ncbi:hypothetical protein BUE76_01855 [Cnuella takakiae]|nr:hypothetical protein BUE76_01855 [Cnuella takakiae]
MQAKAGRWGCFQQRAVAGNAWVAGFVKFANSAERRGTNHPGFHVCKKEMIYIKQSVLTYLIQYWSKFFKKYLSFLVIFGRLFKKTNYFL